jgi:DNA-binding IclR family transcriptional regulator
MIQVINRAIDIIEYVAADPGKPKLMGHIANDLKLNTGTCANIVKTLVNRRLLKKTVKGKGYILGEAIEEIARGSFGYQQLLKKAAVEMDKTEKLLKENCLVAVLKHDKRVVLQRKNSDQLVQATTPDEKNAYDSSTGRLLIAMLPDKDLNDYLKKYGLPAKGVWPDADTKSKLLEQVEKIRSQGYALIEDTVHIVGVATPIYKGDRVVASYSIYLPSFRVNESLKIKLIDNAVEAAKRISS